MDEAGLGRKQRRLACHMMMERVMDQLEHIKKSAVIKRSILINGHKTSISLENEFWLGLHDVARSKNAPVAKLVEQIDRDSIISTSDAFNIASAAW